MIHTIIIILIAIEFCSSPTNIIFCQDFESNLIIDWSQFASNCSIEQYFINTSNCGSCPASTIHNNIICTNTPTDSSDCMITIQSKVHDNIYGDLRQFMITTQAECSFIHESNVAIFKCT